MRRKFKIRNQQKQHLATILFFFEDQLDRNVGMIFTSDLNRMEIWLYENENIDVVIADLAARLNIQYDDHIEVQ
ncbi:hypothetical protein [uncultured Chryseobacterium sp.]|uniref:hypothetical protein n=1 Tax=uncultured Chryseobacterium sp. TaxID=259322 RepID=UPI00374A70D4